MEKFARLTAVAAPLALANVDTDMVIPARFMKALTRAGLGRHLFQELRYDAAGGERPDFILNRGACRQAQILIADRNFGCGSSREHAVWALADFGIRCIVAPSFGDIFSGNARKNGLLLIRLPDALCEQLRNEVELAQFAPVTIDLVDQRITLASAEEIMFEVDPDDRRTLLEGLDDIARTMRHETAIARFERA
ncbi:3-isopropylmalate dehydratase small subunit [Sphingopyxis sp. BSN-002]|uniref:3-isopropylmalate dehydratase small subunit n=1 Tax=Sphingopyxis sp. BSN-002 TaxID=2911495 RepID=UPI001EDA5570|nr:3-isopropylmalate dehydratase small subunit [Sphingopyxis sp. BSN-002]UKK86270.1 3-isopropylmalate dehydratase small subunit [Sphingopyxis sp. BSN-002]